MSQSGTTHHQFAEGYSGRNPVPTVQGFRHDHQNTQQQSPPPPSPPESDTASDSATAVTSPTSPTLTKASLAGAPSADADVNVDVDKDLPPKPAPTPAAVQNDSSKQLKTAINNAGANGDDVPSSQDNGAAKKDTKGESKDEVMAKANANKVKPTDRLKNNKGEQLVRDPITGLDVIIHDANFSSTSKFKNPNLVISVYQ